MRRSNRIAEAFKESFNIMGLAGAVAVSAALLTPAPLIAGVVAEAAYLLFVPDTAWYMARLSKKCDAEVEKRRQDLKDSILPNLRPEMQSRYARLEATLKDIESHPIEGENWFREVLRKLDFLLEKFLLFAAKDNEYRGHLNSILAQVPGSRAIPPQYSRPSIPINDKRKRQGLGAPKGNGSAIPVNRVSVPYSQDIDDSVEAVHDFYEHEMSDVKGQIEEEQDDDTKAILEKRQEVLQRRQEFVGKLGKILSNLNHQLELLEDTFGLINDEIRARSPEQVVSDIDDVVFQTNSMTEVLEELAPYEQMVSRLTAS